MHVTFCDVLVAKARLASRTTNPPIVTRLNYGDKEGAGNRMAGVKATFQATCHRVTEWIDQRKIHPIANQRITPGWFGKTIRIKERADGNEW